MKAALVFTGMARDVKIGADAWHENLIDCNDVDVFSYVWDSMENDANEVARHYYLTDNQPIDYSITYDLTLSHNHIENQFCAHQIGCQRFLEYCNHSGQQYDLVIRARTDLEMQNAIQLEKFQKGFIYIPSIMWPDCPYFTVDDNCSIMDQELYHEVYHDILDWYLSLPGRFPYNNPELRFTQMIVEKGLKDQVERRQELDYLIIRHIDKEELCGCF